MTSFPPQPPGEPAGHITSGAEATDSARTPGSLPQHTSSGPGRPGGHLPVEPADGMWLAIVAVILGALGCVGSLAPVVLDEWREDLALTFGLPGLLAAIIGCIRRRRGDPLTVTGLVLSVIALGLAAAMLFGADEVAKAGKGGLGDPTPEVLREDLEVRLGDPRPTVSGETLVAVTLYNKGYKRASFSVTIKVHNNGESCEASVGVSDLTAGASYQQEISSCESPRPTDDVSLEVVKAIKN